MTAVDERFYYVDFTPDIAKEWLANLHPKQRHFRRSQAAKWTVPMLRGEWEPDGGFIQRDEQERLIQGRHRLTAVVWSGCTVRMAVLDRCGPGVMKVLDTGAPRNHSDTLIVQGYAGPQPKMLSAVNRRLFLWDRNIRIEQQLYDKSVKVLRSPANEELDAYLEDHPEIAGIVEDALRWKITRMQPSITATAAVLFGRRERESMKSFMESCTSGADLSAGSPVLALRERLISDDIRVSANMKAATKLAFAILAWNAYREGRPLQSIHLPKGGLTNDNFPMPK